MIDETSLSKTIDAVNEALFEKRTIATIERKHVAQWIAARQGLPGAYADTFAGFDEERRNGIRAFTGERFTSASARHILGEEASRTVRLLDVRDADVQGALRRADAGLTACLYRAAEDPRNTNPGTFCCGKCTVGLWRNLLSGGLDRQEERLRAGVTGLRARRIGEGEWRVFPFWYTVLALTEMDFAEARAEIKYVAPVLERAAKRTPRSGGYPQRRRAVAQRALALL